MLARDTEWRQGDLLTCEAADALGLAEAADGGRRAIIITHDCDLRHEKELSVEVIVAEQVTAPDPQLSHTKNPRRLHLTYEGAGAAPLVLELRHGDRRSIPKSDFVERAVKDGGLSLPVESKRALKQWLAARYGRAAFPNELEERLRKRLAGRTVEHRIAKILEPHAKYLVGLFFDLGEQRGAEAAEGEPYGLSVSVVYDATEGGRDARGAAESVASRLRDLFEEAYGKPGVATEIALDSCEAVADTYMTLAALRRVDQWRLEYMSLRDDDQGDFLAVGEMPA